MAGPSARLSVDSVEDAWTVAIAQHDGLPLMIRVNTAYRDASDLAAYPIRIGVALPLNKADDQGWPSGPEGEQLQTAEDTILNAIRRRAVLAVVVTGAGMREFVFYARQADWIAEFDDAASAGVETHAVQVVAQVDPSWLVYQRFLPVP